MYDNLFVIYDSDSMLIVHLSNTSDILLNGYLLFYTYVLECEAIYPV